METQMSYNDLLGDGTQLEVEHLAFPPIPEPFGLM